MVRRIPTQESSGAQGLLQMADALERQGQMRNPIIEQALMQAARQQSQASVETAEQAAGMTGAAQVGMAQMAQTQAMGQAMMQAQAQRMQNMQATLGLQAQLRGQAASIEEQRYQTNLQHQQFMAQLEQQAKDARRNRVAGLVGGLAAAASGPLSMALAPEDLPEKAVEAAAGEDGGGLFGMIKSGLGGLKEGVETFQALRGQPPQPGSQMLPGTPAIPTPQYQSPLIQQAAEAFQQRQFTGQAAAAFRQRQFMGMGDFVSPLGYGLG